MLTNNIEQQVFSEIEWQGIIKELSLPRRQSEILKLLFCGHSDKQIAQTLNISLPTVRTYLHRLFEHFNVQDRHELVIYVFEHFRNHCRKVPNCPVIDYYESICNQK
jgi:DNA-binding NarL/FixJ family response regulator